MCVSLYECSLFIYVVSVSWGTDLCTSGYVALGLPIKTLDTLAISIFYTVCTWEVLYELKFCFAMAYRKIFRSTTNHKKVQGKEKRQCNSNT